MGLQGKANLNRILQMQTSSLALYLTGNDINKKTMDSFWLRIR